MSHLKRRQAQTHLPKLQNTKDKQKQKQKDSKGKHRQKVTLQRSEEHRKPTHIGYRRTQQHHQGSKKNNELEPSQMSIPVKGQRKPSERLSCSDVLSERPSGSATEARVEGGGGGGSQGQRRAEQPRTTECCSHSDSCKINNPRDLRSQINPRRRISREGEAD